MTINARRIRLSIAGTLLVLLASQVLGWCPDDETIRGQAPAAVVVTR